MARQRAVSLGGYDLLAGREEDQRCVARVDVSDNVVTIDGEGSGPIEAFVNAMAATLNEPLTVLGYQETALGTGADAQAICILSIDDPDTNVRRYGLGISRNTITASLNAVVSALNRRWAKSSRIVLVDDDFILD